MSIQLLIHSESEALWNKLYIPYGNTLPALPVCLPFYEKLETCWYMMFHCLSDIRMCVTQQNNYIIKKTSYFLLFIEIIKTDLHFCQVGQKFIHQWFSQQII